MQFYGQLPDNFNVVINGNHPLVAEILGEVEASYGDKLKTTNKKLDAAIAEQRSFEELVKDKKAEDFSQEEKDKQQESGRPAPPAYRAPDRDRPREQTGQAGSRSGVVVQQYAERGESDQLYPSQRGTDREIGFSHFRYVKARILVVDYVFFIESEGTKRNSRGGLREL